MPADERTWRRRLRGSWMLPLEILEYADGFGSVTVSIVDRNGSLAAAILKSRCMRPGCIPHVGPLRQRRSGGTAVEPESEGLVGKQRAERSLGVDRARYLEPECPAGRRGRRRG